MEKKEFKEFKKALIKDLYETFFNNNNDNKKDYFLKKLQSLSSSQLNYLQNLIKK